MAVNLMQEDKGIAKIHAVCAQMDAIGRATPCHDLGVDGQIEFLQPGTAMSTGYIIAVQCKSGSSYFKYEDTETVKYYPNNRHRDYWRRIYLPVILVLHDPDRDLTIYTRVKTQVSKDGPLILNKSDIFGPMARENLLGIAVKDIQLLPPSRILNEFKAIKIQRELENTASGIEFLLACTNMKSAYFELRMSRIIVLLELSTPLNMIGLSTPEYEFIHRNILKCLAHKLTEPFVDEYERVWYEENLVPEITVPLTPFGLDVMEYLWSHLESYLSNDTFSHLQAKDLQTLAHIISDTAQAESDLIDKDSI